MRRPSVAASHCFPRRRASRVDGAATDYELVGAIEGVGKRAQVVTHTRGVAQGQPQAPSSQGYLKTQLFFKLLRRQVDCCGQ